MKARIFITGEQIQLADLLNKHMEEAEYGDQRLAGQVNKLVNIPGFLSRANIRNWRAGTSKTARDWRQLAAVAVILRLDLAEASQLLQSASQPSIKKLWLGVNEEDRKFLSYWAESIQNRIDNIPLQRSSPNKHFIGRNEQLEELLEVLQPNRIVTLFGPGGIGKTALATEVTWSLAPDDEPPERFPDGIIFYNFHNQSQADLAFEHIARSFGESLEQGTPRDAARRALSKRKALLVLDGAEKCDDIHTILDERGLCCVLITSQRREHAPDHNYRLDISPLRNDEATSLLQSLAGEGAVDSIVAQEICDLVGGLPLAIQIAGHFLNEKLIEANDYLTWLKEDPIQALNQTDNQQDRVQQVIEHTISNLSEVALHSLTIIGLLARASFNPKVILVTVKESSDISLYKLLAELISYGLLVRDNNRYQISHTLIHTYAQQIPTPIEALDQITEYYITLAKKQSKLGPKGFPELDYEKPHFMTILGHNIEQQNWTAAIDLINATGNYLELQGHWTELIISMKSALEIAQALEDRDNECHSCYKLGELYHKLDHVKKANTYLEQGLAILDQIKDQDFKQSYLAKFGNLLNDLDHQEKAVDRLKKALAISRELDDRHSIAYRLSDLGLVYRNWDQTELALTYLEQALSIIKEIDDHRNEAIILGQIALIYQEREQFAQAIEYYDQALKIAQETGDSSTEATWLMNLGMINTEQKKVELAKDYLQQALLSAQKIGSRSHERDILGKLGILYESIREMENAIYYFQQALSISLEIGQRRYSQDALVALGEIYSKTKQFEQAIDHYQRAISISQEIGDKKAEMHVQTRMGDIYRKRDQLDKAIEHHQQSLIISREIGDLHNETLSLYYLGIDYFFLDQLKLSVKHLQLARDIAKAEGDQQHLQQVWALLTIVYGHLGQRQDAGDAIKKSLEVNPKLTPEIEHKLAQFLQAPDSKKRKAFDNFILALAFQK